MRARKSWPKLKRLLRMVLSLGVIVPATAFAADAKADLAITVFVINFRKAPVAILTKAEDESQKILARAGVRVTWRDCPTGNEPCQKVQGRVLFLSIIAGPAQNKFLDTVSGYALMPHDLAVVLYDYLPRLPGQDRGSNDTAVVLGCVITHELGHLLLGAVVHSNGGIMQANWGVAQIQRALESGLSFLPEEAMRIRANPSREGPRESSALVSESH